MPTKTIKPLYDYGDIVYHLTDPGQCKGIVVGYEVWTSGLKYVVSFNGDSEAFYAFELTETPGEVVVKEENQGEDEEE
jgi:hypothetical protein